MKTKQVERKGTYLRAFRAAFPYTVPVLTGYLFIGMAFGVMIQEEVVMMPFDRHWNT